MSVQEAFAFYKFRRLHERNPKELRPLLIAWAEQALVRHVADVLHELSLSCVNERLDKQEARLALSVPLLSLPSLEPVRPIEPTTNNNCNCVFLTHAVSCSRVQDTDARSAEDDADTYPTEEAEDCADVLNSNDPVSALGDVEGAGMLDLLLAEKFMVRVANPSSQQSLIRSTYAWERRYLCTDTQRQLSFVGRNVDLNLSRSGPHTMNLGAANLFDLGALQLFGLEPINTSQAAFKSSETKSELGRANASCAPGSAMHTSNTAVGLSHAHRTEVTKIYLQWNHLRSLQQLCVAPLCRNALKPGTSVEVMDISSCVYFPAKVASPPRDAPELKSSSDMVYVRLDHDPDIVVLRQITHLRQDMLTKLEVIHAQHNNLRFLCEDPFSLPLEDHRYMQQVQRRTAGNALDGALPESSSELKHLQQQHWNAFPKPMIHLLVLDISHNQLTHVPDLRSMPALQVLRLSHNAIVASSVNDSLAEAHALVEIRLDHNKLLWTDEQSMMKDMRVLKKLSHLRILDLQSNPFEGQVGVREEFQWCAWLMKLQPRLEVLNSKPSLATQALTHLLFNKPIVSFQMFGELLEKAVRVPFTAEVNIAQFRDNAETVAESIRLGPSACGIVRHMFSVMDGTQDEILVHSFMQQVRMAVHKLPISVLQPLAEAIALFSANLAPGSWGGLGDRAFELLLEFLRRRQSETDRSNKLRSSALAAVRTVFCGRLNREFEAKYAHSLHRLYREQRCVDSTKLARVVQRGSNVLDVTTDMLLDIGDGIVIGQKHKEFAIVACIEPLKLREPLKYSHRVGVTVRKVTSTRYFSANTDERAIRTEFHTFVRLFYRKRHALVRQVIQRNIAARLADLALASSDVQVAAIPITRKICVHALLELRSVVDPEDVEQRRQPEHEAAQSHMLRRLSGKTSMPYIQDPLPRAFSSRDVRNIR